jgi:uncharacterized membrane protein
MEEILKQLTQKIALSVEFAAALLIAVGALDAFYQLFIATRFRLNLHPSLKKNIWLGFSTWLILALEFELAADVLRTAISPSWSEVGQLGAIAAIRTFLNFFLEKDIEKISEKANN